MLHVYADKLEELVPLIADDQYLLTVLAYELRGGDTGKNIKLTTAFDDATRERLQKVTAECDESFPNCHRSDDRDCIAESLSMLYRLRANRHRHERLLARLRPTYLRYQIALIGVLLGLFFLCIVKGMEDGAIDPWARFVVVATSGALGSVFAAALRIRDIAELYSFRGAAATTWIQPLIGASIGLMSWLILASGAVTIGQIDSQAWQTQAVVAFASGFSEPLFFGIVGRVVGTR
jgi:hypothetical protein